MKQCPQAPANATSSCGAGICGWTCGPAFVDCDGVAANGCEMPLTQQQSDSKNCGACGHDCLGGACVGGKCQSLVVVSGLVTGFVVYEIAVDRGFLYWVNPTSSNTTEIRQLPLDGGSSIVLASVPEGLTIGYPSAIKVNDDRVYALVSSYDGLVLSVGFDGGGPVSIPTSRHPRGLAIDQSAVYWGSQPQSVGYGVLMKASFDGGSPTPLLNEPLYIEDVATDGFSVFWATGGGRVMRAQVDGGAPSVVAMGQSPSRLAVDAKHLYWTNSAQGTVMKAPLDGGAPVLLAANQGQPGGIALDSTHLYWANVRDNRVMSLTLSGGTLREVTAVDAGPDVGLSGGPFGLALDERNIYFTQPLRGLIWRVAK